MAIVFTLKKETSKNCVNIHQISIRHATITEQYTVRSKTADVIKSTGCINIVQTFDGNGMEQILQHRSSHDVVYQAAHVRRPRRPISGSSHPDFASTTTAPGPML